MTDSFWLNALIVSATTLASAWCWVIYNRAINQRHPIRAALADCGIIGLSMISVVSYVDDHRLAAPILLSAFVGTVLAVRAK